MCAMTRVTVLLAVGSASAISFAIFAMVGWVEKTHGEAVVKNATLLDMWIQKFERYVCLLWSISLDWLLGYLGEGGVYGFD